MPETITCDYCGQPVGAWAEYPGGWGRPVLRLCLPCDAETDRREAAEAEEEWRRAYMDNEADWRNSRRQTGGNHA
jgi:hypothetical protein